MKTITITTAAALFLCSTAGVLAGCGAVERPEIAPSHVPDPAPSDVATAPAMTSADTQLFAVDSAGTRVYALELIIDDVTVLPIGDPVEAATERAVHVMVLGSAPMPVDNTGACARLDSPLPPDQDPCARSVIIHPSLHASEVGGVLVLSSRTDTLITGQVDAFVADSDDARGNFSFALGQ